MWGGDGNDTMLGYRDTDKLYGESGNDTLRGDDNAGLVWRETDYLYGGDGNDDLNGGWGLDYLSGGQGMDRFHYVEEWYLEFILFVPTTHEYYDTLLDYNASEDVLYI